MNCASFQYHWIYVQSTVFIFFRGGFFTLQKKVKCMGYKQYFFFNYEWILKAITITIKPQALKNLKLCTILIYLTTCTYVYMLPSICQFILTGSWCWPPAVRSLQSSRSMLIGSFAHRGRLQTSYMYDIVLWWI